MWRVCCRRQSLWACNVLRCVVRRSRAATVSSQHGHVSGAGVASVDPPLQNTDTHSRSFGARFSPHRIPHQLIRTRWRSLSPTRTSFSMGGSTRAVSSGSFFPQPHSGEKRRKRDERREESRCMWEVMLSIIGSSCSIIHIDGRPIVLWTVVLS